MPAQEISIPYKSPALMTLRVLSFLTFPIWGFTAPLVFLASVVTAAFGIISLVLSGRSFEIIGLLSTFFFLCISGGFCYVGMRILALSYENQLFLSDDGLSFPANFWGSLQGRRLRGWEDLSELHLDRKGVKNANQINFVFRSGGDVRLNLDSIASDKREKFLLAIEVWAKQACEGSEITELLDGLHDDRAKVGQLSYTTIWENEFNRQFASTAFVPLQRGHELQSGRLSVVQPLAFGGLSAIYLAQRNDTDLVVLKESVVESLQDQAMLEKAQELFDREASILTKLAHPRIAKVYDHFVEAGRSYLVLEYIDGQNIRRLVKESGAPEQKLILAWIRQLAEVVDYIHAQDPPIIHRDLTPDNIVLRGDDSIVVIDFGAANQFVGTATGTLVGKQAYIAPEQFRGKATPQSDIYAFGGTIYFLLTGNDPEPLSQSRPRAIKPSVDTRLDDLVACCTAFEASERPTSALAALELIKSMGEQS